jgi:hypothetical protein
MTVPTLNLGQTGLLINGGSTAATSLPQVSGTTFRSVGNDGMPNSVAVDAFGTGAFPAFIHRSGRGTSAAPTATKNGDTIGRWGAVGWGDTNFVIDPIIGRAASDIRFVATEDFTDAHGGTQIQFYTSPNGGTHRTLSVTMDYTGITTGNIHSTNVFVSGNTISQGTTNLIGEVTTQGNLNVNGNLSIEGTSINTGTTLMIGNTTTVGTTTLTGDVTITGNVNTTGAAANFGTSNFNGAMTINGPMSINNQISLTALGNIAFNDGTVQSTASIKQINNGAHITGALGFSGNARTLSLSVDATPNNTASTIVARDAAGNIAVGNISATTLNTTSITANSSIAGSLTVYGNLNVVGTTVTTQAVVTTVDTKTFTIASNAVSAIAADGAAFLVANVAGHSVADWTYDNGQAAWRSNISVVPSQNDGANLGSSTRNWGELFASNAYITSKLNVGTLPINNFNTVAQFTGNVGSWSQITNQNTSSNIYASTDFVAINDVGTDVINYIDVGINSSTNADPAYSIMKSNDGYMYVNGGNLALGTQTLGKDIVFFTDDTIASKEAGRIHLGRWILGGTDNGVDKLQVTGNVTVGNISATNLTNQFATLTANAATQAAQITAANAAIVTANTAVVSYVNTLNTAMIANVVAANAAIVTANTAMKSYVDAVTTAWTSNAASQATQISTNSANIAAANVNIATLQTQVYANANVAAYLPTYSGTQSTMIAQEQIYVLGNNYVYTNATTNQGNLFPLVNGVTLASNTRYHFAIKAEVTRSSGANATLNLAFAGTAGILRVTYYYVTNGQGGVNNQNIVNSTSVTSAFTTGTAITTSQVGPYPMEVFGIVDVTSGGTFAPTVGFSVAPSTVTVGAHSLMRIFPIGNITGNTVIGSWS